MGLFSPYPGKRRWILQVGAGEARAGLEGLYPQVALGRHGDTAQDARVKVGQSVPPAGRVWKRRLAVTVLTACLLGGITPGTAATDKPAMLAVVNGTLIDGTGADPVPDGVVLIQEGRILAAGARGDVDFPAGATVIDVKGAARSSRDSSTLTFTMPWGRTWHSGREPG